MKQTPPTLSFRGPTAETYLHIIIYGARTIKRQLIWDVLVYTVT